MYIFIYGLYIFSFFACLRLISARLLPGAHHEGIDLNVWSGEGPKPLHHPPLTFEGRQCSDHGSHNVASTHRLTRPSVPSLSSHKCIRIEAGYAVRSTE